jgi:hypothetical protein
MKKRYVWLNIEDGKFSDSWDEETHQKFLTNEDIEDLKKRNPEWKLISYECLNDENFEFNHHMVIR